MRSALLDVKGVSRVKVTLEPSEAVVTYDPRQASLESLLSAVKKAEGPSEYSATVKTAIR